MYFSNLSPHSTSPTWSTLLLELVAASSLGHTISGTPRQRAEQGLQVHLHASRASLRPRGSAGAVPFPMSSNDDSIETALPEEASPSVTLRRPACQRPWRLLCNAERQTASQVEVQLAFTACPVCRGGRLTWATLAFPPPYGRPRAGDPPPPLSALLGKQATGSAFLVGTLGRGTAATCAWGSSAARLGTCCLASRRSSPGCLALRKSRAASRKGDGPPHATRLATAPEPGQLSRFGNLGTPCVAHGGTCAPSRGPARGAALLRPPLQSLPDNLPSSSPPAFAHMHCSMWRSAIS